MTVRGAYDQVLSRAPRKKRKGKKQLLGKTQRKTKGPRVMRV